MPVFKVMCYRDDVWDGLGPRVVEAQDAREAAARVCGEPVAVGADRKSPIYVKVWPLLPAVEWFHLSPTGPDGETGGIR